jgi:uncharacterized membrane protein YedE/YeeE
MSTAFYIFIFLAIAIVTILFILSLVYHKDNTKAGAFGTAGIVVFVASVIIAILWVVFGGYSYNQNNII